MNEDNSIFTELFDEICEIGESLITWGERLEVPKGVKWADNLGMEKEYDKKNLNSWLS